MNDQWRQTGLMITSADRAGREILWNKRDQHKAPITILSGRGKKTTSAMALMDWSVWRHWNVVLVFSSVQLGNSE